MSEVPGKTPAGPLPVGATLSASLLGYGCTPGVVVVGLVERLVDFGAADDNELSFPRCLIHDPGAGEERGGSVSRCSRRGMGVIEINQTADLGAFLVGARSRFFGHYSIFLGFSTSKAAGGGYFFGLYREVQPFPARPDRALAVFGRVAITLL